MKTLSLALFLALLMLRPATAQPEQVLRDLTEAST